jgi:hypothetical protein
VCKVLKNIFTTELQLNCEGFCWNPCDKLTMKMTFFFKTLLDKFPNHCHNKLTRIFNAACDNVLKPSYNKLSIKIITHLKLCLRKFFIKKSHGEVTIRNIILFNVLKLLTKILATSSQSKLSSSLCSSSEDFCKNSYQKVTNKIIIFIRW